jgi:hypothetical protein
MEIRSTQRNSGDMKVKREADDAKTKAPTVLTCIPGIKPVTAPHITPKRQAAIRSKIQITLSTFFIKRFFLLKTGWHQIIINNIIK